MKSLYKQKKTVKRINEAYSSETIDVVKKNEASIKSFINKALKKFYSVESKKESKDNYDWRKSIKGCPQVHSFDYDFCEIPMIILSGGQLDHDDELFFEDDFCRWLKKENPHKEYIFYCEDYPGIFVEVRNIKAGPKMP